jgi:hypothetical protein
MTMTTPMMASTTIATAIPMTSPRPESFAAAVGCGVEAVTSGSEPPAVASGVAGPEAAGVSVPEPPAAAPHGVFSLPAASVAPAGGW